MLFIQSYLQYSNNNYNNIIIIHSYYRLMSAAHINKRSSSSSAARFGFPASVRPPELLIGGAPNWRESRDEACLESLARVDFRDDDAVSPPPSPSRALKADGTGRGRALIGRFGFSSPSIFRLGGHSSSSRRSEFILADSSRGQIPANNSLSYSLSERETISA